MSSRTFDDDPVTGQQIIWHENPDDTITIEETQEVGDILADAKGLRNNEDSWRPWRTQNEMASHHIADIPLTIYFQLMKEGKLPDQDPKAFRKWWNQVDNPWRTKVGWL